MPTTSDLLQLSPQEFSTFIHSKAITELGELKQVRYQLLFQLAIVNLKEISSKNAMNAIKDIISRLRHKQHTQLSAQLSQYLTLTLEKIDSFYTNEWTLLKGSQQENLTIFKQGLTTIDQHNLIHTTYKDIKTALQESYLSIQKYAAMKTKKNLSYGELTGIDVNYRLARTRYTCEQFKQRALEVQYIKNKVNALVTLPAPMREAVEELKQRLSAKKLTQEELITLKNHYEVMKQSADQEMAYIQFQWDASPRSRANIRLIHEAKTLQQNYTRAMICLLDIEIELININLSISSQQTSLTNNQSNVIVAAQSSADSSSPVSITAVKSTEDLSRFCETVDHSLANTKLEFSYKNTRHLILFKAAQKEAVSSRSNSALINVLIEDSLDRQIQLAANT